ncbi:MAG: hypothetical protein GXP48_08345, partial [Acidobacteria bacterium]|nr:hypothetical protein [Acidobacteriota bacterium]
LLFDEPVQPASGFDLASAVSITRGGQPVDGAATRVTSKLLKWTPTDPTTYPIGGTYTLSSLNLADLASNTIGATPTSFTHLSTSDQTLLLAYAAPTDTQREAQSAYGLTTLFQGRTWHADLGMYSYRNRWYLPETGVFGERDPLGPVDSVDLYQYVGYDPQNLRDPFGLRDDWDVGPFGKTNPAYQRAMERYRNRPRVVVLPVLDFVEAWYADPKTHEVFGSTVTTALVDVQGRLLPLDEQARLLKKYPILPRYDNPGLAQLIRSPKLIKLTYAQQEALALQFLRLNLKIIQYGGMKVAIVATAVGALPIAGTALAVGETAGLGAGAIDLAKDVRHRNVRGFMVHAALLVMPEEINKSIKGARLLMTEEKIVLQAVNDFTFSVTGEAADETKHR